MAKRQGPRPTVRISRDPNDAAPRPVPVTRRPVQRRPSAALAPDRREASANRPINAAQRGASILRSNGLGAPVRPTLPASRGQVISPAPSVAGVIGPATAPPMRNGTHAPLPQIARSATVRTREAGLRLFGDYSYVKHDLRRIAILTISGLVLLVAVSFLLPLWLK